MRSVIYWQHPITSARLRCLESHPRPVYAMGKQRKDSSLLCSAHYTPYHTHWTEPSSCFTHSDLDTPAHCPWSTTAASPVILPDLPSPMNHSSSGPRHPLQDPGWRLLRPSQTAPTCSRGRAGTWVEIVDGAQECGQLITIRTEKDQATGWKVFFSDSWGPDLPSQWQQEGCPG